MKKKGIVIGLSCLIVVLLAAIGAVVFYGKSRENQAEGSSSQRGTVVSEIKKTEETTETDDVEGGNRTEENAVGNLSGNINNGGYVVENEEYVFYSYQGVLWRIGQDGTGKRALYEGECSSLNLWNDRIYFLLEEKKEGGDYGFYTNRTPCRISLNGEDFETIGPTLPEDKVRVSYSEPVKYGRTAAYRGFTVCDGYIYYIGSNGRAGSYSCSADYGDRTSQKQSVVFVDNTSVYRMDPDGSNVTELIGNIGNASPQMCIDHGQLYYTISYYNYYFSPYDFTRYCRADMKTWSTTELPVESSVRDVFNSDFGANTDYVLSIQIMDGKLYASFGDSEGEFPDSRFHVYDETNRSFGEPLFEERSWNGTVAFGGKLYGSGGGREYTEDGAALTNRALTVFDTSGRQEKLLKVFDEETYGGDEWFNNLHYEINVSGGWAYYRCSGWEENGEKEELGRISLDGSRQEFFTGL